MKASEMTNGMLAHNLEATIPFLMKEARHLIDADEIMTEAAARLRRADDVKTAYDRAVSADARHAVENERLKGEVAAIRAKLKVAEDALEAAWMYASKLPHQWPLPERVRAKMKNALAAIAEEGDAK